MTKAKLKPVTVVNEPTNGAIEVIEASAPYAVNVAITGTSDFLFHRWNVESVEAKSKAAKGSAAKKSDDLSSYVYRNEAGELAIPGEYVRQSIIHAAKYRQDPRSPRKSAMDLYRAGVQSLTNLASLGQIEWDYEDKRRVVVQRNGVTRTRPALRAGWTIDLELLVLLPEYIPPDHLHDVLINAGRLVGVGDFRPTYGRFQITQWKIN